MGIDDKAGSILDGRECEERRRDVPFDEVLRTRQRVDRPTGVVPLALGRQGPVRSTHSVHIVPSRWGNVGQIPVAGRGGGCGEEAAAHGILSSGEEGIRANADVQIRHISETVLSAIGSTENRAIQHILEGAVDVAAASLWGNGAERRLDGVSVLAAGTTRFEDV